MIQLVPQPLGMPSGSSPISKSFSALKAQNAHPGTVDAGQRRRSQRLDIRPADKPFVGADLDQQLPVAVVDGLGAPAVAA